MEGHWLKNRFENFISLSTAQARLAVIIIGCLFLSIFDLTSLNLPDLCLWEKIFGYCPADGTTRALNAFFQGRFQQAISYNKNVIIIIPVIFSIFISDALKLLKKGKKKP